MKSILKTTILMIAVLMAASCDKKDDNNAQPSQPTPKVNEFSINSVKYAVTKAELSSLTLNDGTEMGTINLYGPKPEGSDFTPYVTIMSEKFLTQELLLPVGETVIKPFNPITFTEKDVTINAYITTLDAYQFKGGTLSIENSGSDFVVTIKNGVADGRFNAGSQKDVPVSFYYKGRLPKK